MMHLSTRTEPAPLGPGGAVVVTGKGPAVITTPQDAAAREALLLRGVEPPYRLWTEWAAS